MDLGALIASLGVDSTQLRNAEAELRRFDSTAQSAFGGANSAISTTISQMGALVGITLGVAGAFYAVEKAVRFSISAQEEFRLSTIQIGSGLTNMAKEGQGSFEKMFKQNFQYAQQMYDEIRKEDAKRFSSAQDLMTAYNALVQKGYAVRLDEVDAMGVLTDKIKLATAGQNTQMQINQEIRGLLDGQVRAGSLLAMELQSRLGPAWKEQVVQHRKAGDLLQWLASMWPGIAAACAEVENTLEAQSTTLSGNLKSIGRQGMLGAYEMTVGILRDINEHLRDHEQKYIVGIARGWATVKWTIDRIAETLDNIQGSIKIEIPEKSLKDMTAMEVVAKNFKKAFETSPNVIISEPISQASDFWSGFTSGLQNWGKAGDQVFISWADYYNNSIIPIIKTVDDFFKNNKEWLVDWDTPNKELEDIKSKVNWLLDIFSQPVTWAINAVISGLPSWLSGGGVPILPERRLTTPDKSLEEAKRQAELRAKGMTEYLSPTFGKMTVPYWAVPEKMGGPPQGQTVPKPPPGEEGGKGAEAEANRLNSLFDTLTKDIARLSGGKLSEIEANYVRTVEQIYKKTRDQAADEADLVVLAKQREVLQKEQLQDDFNLKMAKGSGDIFLEINEQYGKDLRDFGGLEGAKERLAEFYGRKRLIAEVERGSEILNLNKAFIDTMSGLSTILDEQLGLKERSLALENELAQAAITRLVAEKPYLAHLEDELRLRQALTNQAKKYALERERWQGQGMAGGWEAYRFERGQAAQKRDFESVKGWMDFIESGMGSRLAQGWVDALQGKKMDLKALMTDMAGWFIEAMVKHNIAKLFDTLFARPAAPVMAGAGGEGGLASIGGTFSAGGRGLERLMARDYQDFGREIKDFGRVVDRQGNIFKDIGKDFTASSRESYEASKGMTGFAVPGMIRASDQSGMAAAAQQVSSIAQIGAAAGMGLAAIGMLTGSKELTMAGTVISVAATLLQTASMLMMAKWWHSGGIVAHSGLMVAHAGLAPDDVPSILQKGEWVLSRRAAGRLAAYGDDVFDNLNSGRLPVLPIAGGDSGSNVQIGTIQVNIDAPGADRSMDWDNIVNKKIIPGLEKKFGNHGLRFIPGRH